MKRLIATILLFGLLLNTSLAQSPYYSSYHKPIGSGAYSHLFFSHHQINLIYCGANVRNETAFIHMTRGGRTWVYMINPVYQVHSAGYYESSRYDYYFGNPGQYHNISSEIWVNYNEASPSQTNAPCIGVSNLDGWGDTLPNVQYETYLALNDEPQHNWPEGACYSFSQGHGLCDHRDRH